MARECVLKRDCQWRFLLFSDEEFLLYYFSYELEGKEYYSRNSSRSLRSGQALPLRGSLGMTNGERRARQATKSRGGRVCVPCGPGGGRAGAANTGGQVRGGGPSRPVGWRAGCIVGR